MKRRFDKLHLPPRPQTPPARLITSLANPLVKDIRALAMRKVREEAGLFIAEGLKLVADAIASGWAIRFLVHRSGERSPTLAKAIAATAACSSSRRPAS